MRNFSIIISALLLALLLPGGAPVSAEEAGERSDTSVNLSESGVIHDIREVRRERPLPKSDRPLPVGPVLRFSLGDKADKKPHIDVFGSRAMREEWVDVYYEVVIRYDDNRWGRIKLPDVSGLKAGDRIHVQQNLVEPDDGDRK